MTSIYRALASSTTPNAISKGVSKPRVTPDFYHSTLSLCDNHVRVLSSRVTPDSYHSTLSFRDNLTVCFHLGQHNSSAYTSSLLRSHRNSIYLPGPLTPQLQDSHMRGFTIPLFRFAQHTLIILHLLNRTMSFHWT